MNPEINKEKIAKLLLTFLVFIVNTIIPLNMSLCGSTEYLIPLLIVGIAASCWLFAARGLSFGIVSTCIGGAVAVAVSPTLFSVVASVLALPFGVSFYLLSRKQIGRGTAISAGAGASTVIICAYVLINTLITTGSVSLDSIIKAYNTALHPLREAIVLASVTTVAGVSVSTVTPVGADKYIYALIGMAPGMIFALLAVLGFISTWIFKKFLNLSEGRITAIDSWKLSPSPITAILFIVSLILSLTLEKTNAISLTAINITLILGALLFLAGLSSAFGYKMINGYKLPKLLRPALLIISLFISTATFVVMCLIFGVFDSVKTLIPKTDTED